MGVMTDAGSGNYGSSGKKAVWVNETRHLRHSRKIFRKNFSFSIDTPDAGVIVCCVIKQYILREGGNADEQGNTQAGENRQIPHTACARNWNFAWSH